ncbi:MAG: ABC transporter permease subunit [Calditrichae bacterium]|nr:ABC transporter permease subunit [Calditrichia bacterium]NIW79429.1 ABC transporter permease subunit [Calditrichia bacterium]
MLESLLEYTITNWQSILLFSGLHVGIVSVSAAIAFLIAFPSGILLTRSRWRQYSQSVLALANVFQTVPSLAVIGLASALLAIIQVGIGWVPAILALVLYSILPILSNTIVGLENVSAATIHVARGMGLSNLQILFKIEIPLALSVILAGVRTALVINIGTAALAATIGADCLGTLIFQGISTGNTALLLAGAIPTAALAIVVDLALAYLERLAISEGIRI